MDRRYLLVSADGRYTTLGRQVKSDEEVLDTAAAGLDATGMTGWLILSEGRYYGGEDVSLFPIRCLTTKSGDWQAATAKFRARRITIYYDDG